ncbi:MAG: helix-turn-helix domain-containing protein [Nanoarchaeota archaeon]|nr:helix-turn-helix domain-containing protein [Nanoarchaeota archaeon]
MISLDDERIASLADAISNKTCKKILEYLVDNEACETEIVRDLKMKANTVNYNVKKLLKAGLIECSREFFWSVKGKKIIRYKVAKKKIVISPKSSSVARNILGAFFATGIVGFLVKIFVDSKEVVQDKGSIGGVNDAVVSGGVDFAESGGVEFAESFAIESAQSVSNLVPVFQSSDIWIWFLFGGTFALILFMILNWRKL